jgi:hypothetical protein
VLIANDAELVSLAKKDLLPQFRKENEHLDWLDRWLRWDHDKPHSPRHATIEYKELAGRAQAPWLALVVTSVVQSLYVEGYRSATATEDASPWNIWQANGFDRRQIAIHRDAIAYGYSYVTVLPGELPSGEAMPAMRGVSPRRMLAFYEDPAEDDWPSVVIHAKPGRHEGNNVLNLKVYDDNNIHYLRCAELGDAVEVVSESEEHGVGFVPVVRYANQIDLEGRTPGEVEPYISVAGRIDQTAFDRLVVQRFASWAVRTIAGMSKPDDGTDAQAEKLRLKVEDILIADDPDTKFGSLPATPLDGFIKAHEADIGVLAAVSQTPAHELLGQQINLSAEALAAARASADAKVDERKHGLGESHEQALRLGALIQGDFAAATDYTAQVRWKDTSIRSLAQAADGLGKLAQMLGVPPELLWEKIPGFTQQDVDTAKAIVAEGGGMDALLASLQGGQEPPNLSVA